MATDNRSVRGSCCCGRNNYIIVIPLSAVKSARINLEGACSGNRKADDARSTAWLRVPLTWFQSHTTSFFPDETHSMIRKTFTPPHEPHYKKIFCGYCGTHLTRWSEDPEDEAEILSITVDSIFGEDMVTLDELGLLHDDEDDDVDRPTVKLEQKGIMEEPSIQGSVTCEDKSQTTVQPGAEEDVFWTEELTEQTRFGQSRKTKRHRGRNTGSTMIVEWEITEIVDDASEAESGSGRGKRKLAQTA